MIKTSKVLKFGVVIAVAIAGNAMAAPLKCPAVSDIKQTPGSYGGFAYTAAAGDGKQWTGENIMANESDLRATGFKEAYILNARNFVACDYVLPNDQGGGMRMSIKIDSSAKAVGANWQNQKQPDGSVLPRCVADKPQKCTFQLG